MLKTYKYRIYPSKAQATTLNKMLEECCWVYNKLLDTRIMSYELYGKKLGRYDIQNMLPNLKKLRPSLKQVYSSVLQNVAMRVDLAFKAFFRRVKSGEEKPGFPRFKSYGRYNSLCYPQYNYGIKLDGNNLITSKVGSIKIKLHRELCGKPKTICIKRSSDNKWFATIICDYSPTLLPNEPKRIGVDVGTTVFAAFSNSDTIKNPRFFKNEQKTLTKVQRKLEKIPKGTAKRIKCIKALNKVHTRITNKRSDFAHKVSRYLVNNYGIIAIEKLDIVSMMAKHKVIYGQKLNKSIADVAWNQFAQFLIYKAEDAGRLLVQVDPRNTSAMCSRCRSLVPKELGIRIHDCPHCGLVLDRDHNAAINILALGLQSISTGLPDEAIEAQQL